MPPKNSVGSIGRTALAIGKRPTDASTAELLSKALVGMEPWLRLRMTQPVLAELLKHGYNKSSECWCLTVNDEPAGAQVTWNEWLRGPYLAHLSVIPEFQRKGLGQWALDDWQNRTWNSGQRNLWLCVSSFNEPAKTLYAKNGFETVGELKDLLVDGLDEILMRKRLTASAVKSA